MKNRWLFILALVALVLSAALPVTSVEAAGKTATLVEFKHLPAKGWTAVFAISGNWKDSDLKGNTITVGDNTYDLYCNFRDDEHVSCTMSHEVGMNAGKSAIIFFGGQTFTSMIPSKIVCNGYGFYTVSIYGDVWFNIADSFEEGMAMASDMFGETYVPGPGVQCITDEWAPYWAGGYYWEYRGNIYDDGYIGPPMG